MILIKITNLVNYFKALDFLNLDIYDDYCNKNLNELKSIKS